MKKSINSIAAEEILENFGSFSIVESHRGVRPIAERLVLGSSAPAKGKWPAFSRFFSFLIDQSATASDEERSISHNLDPSRWLSSFFGLFVG